MIYVIYFADLGTPKTGLSPTLDIFIKVSDGGSAGVPPVPTELSGGFYKFTYVPTEDVAIRVDSNDANMADRDRYIVLIASLHDTGLEDIKGTGFVKDTDSLVDIRPETDKIQSRATQASVDTVQNDVTKIIKVQKGRWQIKNNQFIIYDTNGITALYTFNLRNADGQPAMKDVLERVPV